MCEFCKYAFWKLKVYKQKKCATTVCFTLLVFRENMFTTTTFTSIRFTFTICSGANEQPVMWQQFQPFWLFGSLNSIFPWNFRQSSLHHILFIKLKSACSKRMFVLKCKKNNAYILYWERNGNIFINIRLSHGYSIITASRNYNQSNSQSFF